MPHKQTELKLNSGFPDLDSSSSFPLPIHASIHLIRPKMGRSAWYIPLFPLTPSFHSSTRSLDSSLEMCHKSDPLFLTPCPAVLARATICYLGQLLAHLLVPPLALLGFYSSHKQQRNLLDVNITGFYLTFQGFSYIPGMKCHMPDLLTTRPQITCFLSI